MYTFDFSGVVNVLVTTPLWVVNTRLKLQGIKLKVDKDGKDAHKEDKDGKVTSSEYKNGKDSHTVYRNGKEASGELNNGHDSHSVYKNGKDTSSEYTNGKDASKSEPENSQQHYKGIWGNWHVL